MSFGPGDLLKIMEEQVPFNRLLGIKGESAEPGQLVAEGTGVYNIHRTKGGAARVGGR